MSYAETQLVTGFMGFGFLWLVVLTMAVIGLCVFKKDKD